MNVFLTILSAIYFSPHFHTPTCVNYSTVVVFIIQVLWVCSPKKLPTGTFHLKTKNNVHLLTTCTYIKNITGMSTGIHMQIMYLHSHIHVLVTGICFTELLIANSFRPYSMHQWLELLTFKLFVIKIVIFHFRPTEMLN